MSAARSLLPSHIVDVPRATAADRTFTRASKPACPPSRRDGLGGRNAIPMHGQTVARRAAQAVPPIQSSPASQAARTSLQLNSIFAPAQADLLTASTCGKAPHQVLADARSNASHF